MNKSYAAIERFNFFLMSISLILVCPLIGASQQVDPEVPFVGAQVFIEPGQTSEQVESYFKILSSSHMTVCRIRMFESYMRKKDGTWDFAMFDRAFELADKHGIKVLATLFPYTEKTDIGGIKYPRDKAHLDSIASYIKHVVTHFKNYENLYGWVLINEPGTGFTPSNVLANKRYEEWLIDNAQEDYTDQGVPILVDIDEKEFRKDNLTWFLSWIAEKIRKYDRDSHLHVNSHAIFNLIAEYDFPEWRKFLNSLGGSAHPSWHFGYFDRKDYCLAMSANSEIIRSGAGELPWIMTEIQGGNNTYSGFAPFCPSKEEITQWMWITIGTEAKGSIFWTLNPRSSGVEAGEWALLTYQNQPSERFIAAEKVAQTINQYASLFGAAKEVDSGINILYFHESLWAEESMSAPSKQNYEGRENGAVIKSVLAYYKAFCELGVNCNIKEYNEFNFSKEDYTGEVIILANQISVPRASKESLETFVSRGGRLIVEGLTAFFDDNLHNTTQGAFVFENLFGGNISEFKLVDRLFNLEIQSHKIPCHLWRGTVNITTGDPIRTESNNKFAIRNRFGEGEVLWVPSLLGLGARVSGNYTPLANWLKDVLDRIIEGQAIVFSKHVPGMIMKTMKVNNHLITILVNKSEQEQKLYLMLRDKKLTPFFIFSSENNKVVGCSPIELKREETLVLEWSSR